MPGGAFRSAPGSLNCDDDVGGYGACFDRTADSPPIDLSPLAGVGATGATVASWCNYDLEEDDCLNDRRAVVISSDGFASALGQYCFKFADCGDPDTWHQHEVPLHWTWGTIQVRLLFDSLDGLACETCFDG